VYIWHDFVAQRRDIRKCLFFKGAHEPTKVGFH
jgi:hypothetical protein